VGTGDRVAYPDLPDSDIDGDARPQGAGYDMGADEFVRPAIPVIIILPDKAVYTPGETLSTTLQITAGSEPAVADVYIRLHLPNGTYYYYPTWSTNPRPVVRSWAVTDWGPETIFTYTFTGSEPAGTYTWEAALTEPGTANLIGEASSAAFSFQP